MSRHSRLIKLLPYGGSAARVLTTLHEAAFPAGFAGGVTAWHPLAVSPDGKYALMTQQDHRQSNIMIAKGFH
jgi:hypothetical protein